MNAASPGLGDYTVSNRPDNPPGSSGGYWMWVRPHVLAAIGLFETRADTEEMLQPEAPSLPADQLHPWVWEAAQTQWGFDQHRIAVSVAAQAVESAMQQKAGKRDRSGADLVRRLYSKDPPRPGEPRLRMPGDRSTEGWIARQEGAMEFGAGCFTGIRNASVHESDEWDRQVALERLAALSVFARWVNESTVET